MDSYQVGARSNGKEKKVRLSGEYFCMSQVPAVELLLNNGADAKAKTPDDLTILGMTNFISKGWLNLWG